MSTPTRRDFLLATASAAMCACALCPLAEALGADAAGPIDVGPLHQIQPGISDAFLKSGRFFLVRDANRVYAPSAICTHKRAALALSADGIKCPKHGSTFSRAGEVTTGPAKSALPRLSIRLNDQGHVIVDPSKQFDPDQWSHGESFVEMK